MTAELTVVIKDDEKTLRKKFLVYDSFHVSEDDPVIKDCIDQTLNNFAGEPDRVTVKISLYLR